MPSDQLQSESRSPLEATLLSILRAAGTPEGNERQRFVPCNLFLSMIADSPGILDFDDCPASAVPIRELVERLDSGGRRASAIERAARYGRFLTRRGRSRHAEDRSKARCTGGRRTSVVIDCQGWPAVYSESLCRCSCTDDSGTSSAAFRNHALEPGAVGRRRGVDRSAGRPGHTL